jgi:hypothetical protein
MTIAPTAAKIREANLLHLTKFRRIGSRYLWYPRERIDIAISATSWIEPRRCKFYSWGKKSVISQSPFVEICIAPYVREKIYRLSKQIVGGPLDFVINGEDVM